MADLDQALASRRTANAEIAASWFVLVIKSTYQPGYPRLETVSADDRPPDAARAHVYRAHEDAGRRDLAKRVYRGGRPIYQAHTAAALDAIVTPASETSDDE